MTDSLPNYGPSRLHHADTPGIVDLDCGDWPHLRFVADGKETIEVAETQVVKSAELAALIAGWQAKLGDMKHKVDLLMSVFRSAEELSSELVVCESDGADLPISLEEPWTRLTADIQAAYNGLGEGLKHGIVP